MPSSPILQAWRNTLSPSWARCSVRRSPGRVPRSRLASVALRVSIGSRRRSWPSSSSRSKACGESASSEAEAPKTETETPKTETESPKAEAKTDGGNESKTNRANGQKHSDDQPGDLIVV